MNTDDQNSQRPQAQAWLQEIYDHPERYEGRVVVLLNSEYIMGVGANFDDAIALAANVRQSGRITYFGVPRNIDRLRILTLRFRSLREDLWLPMYAVTLQTEHSEIAVEMLIDSGADISLISKIVGERLGLERTKEEDILSAQGIGGTVDYLLRRLTVVIDGHSVSASVAWCQNDDIVDMIIGRKDVFHTFNVEFRQNEHRIVFTPVLQSA